MITAFRIVAIVFIALGLIAAVVILRFLAGALKKRNSSFAGRTRGVREQMAGTISGIDEAQGRIEALEAATDGVKKGMDRALAFSDGAVVFLESRAFQAGVPLVLWLLFAAVLVPRSFRAARTAARKRRRKVIPPPSWEKAAAE